MKLLIDSFISFNDTKMHTLQATSQTTFSKKRIFNLNYFSFKNLIYNNL